MIKAIITDVDGVMVGKSGGPNFPLPSKDVLLTLQKISEHSVPIILCTGKFGFAIKDIVVQAKLNNPHISDGGAVIFNPITRTMLRTHLLEKEVIKSLVAEGLQHGYYIECYGVENYYVQKNQQSAFTNIRTSILQKEPLLVDSLEQVIDTEPMPKVNIYVPSEKEIPEVDNMLKKYASTIAYLWTNHPAHMPVQTCVITKPNVSKESAAKEVADMLHLSFDDVLGIGDTEGDWRFMQLCKYVATVGDHDKKLSELVQTKGEGNYFCARSVDDNGLLETFAHFGLIKEG